MLPIRLGFFGRAFAAAGLACSLSLACAQASGSGAAPDPEKLRQTVTDVERAFAKTMADRDFAAFGKFLSKDTVFKGSKASLRGPAAVLEVWKKFFDGPKPPFSWEPDTVEVMTNGELALSSGPVRDPDGKLVARFNSVWRQEAPGVWRIVLDMGNDACECGKP